MAVAVHDLQRLIARGDNDNCAREPGGGSLHQPPRGLQIRPGLLELDYPNLATRLEAETRILWAYMRHPERACFTPGLMSDGRHFQTWLRGTFAGRGRHELPFSYLVWASRAPGAWSMGGDLAAFLGMIRSRDATGLRAYAHLSIEVLHANYEALGLPIQTVALVQGDAIGGGFEALLTHDLVIAERQARFGLPEILFNLFPGMGAYSFLRRKVGQRLARELIEDGKTRSADEMLALGLVDIVCERGQAELRLRQHVAEHAGRFAAEVMLRQARHRADPVSKGELFDIVDLWVELALDLSEADLRRMACLARHQERHRARA